MTKKKKIIIMSSLVFLLAVTAILNVLLVTNNAAADADAVTTANYFSTYRSERTTTRSEELLQLDSVIELYDEGSERYEQAVDLKMQIINRLVSEINNFRL